MLRERGERALAVAVETANVENSEAWLKQRVEHTTIGMRVGAVLYRRNLRVDEIVDRWEATDGEVDKAQCEFLQAPSPRPLLQHTDERVFESRLSQFGGTSEL